MMPNTITISGTRYVKVECIDRADPTPLEQVVGFSIAEEIYDLLPERDQLVLDLQIAGWNQTQIAKVFNLSQSTISINQRRIRGVLANTKLKLILESRVK